MLRRWVLHSVSYMLKFLHTLVFSRSLQIASISYSIDFVIYGLSSANLNDTNQRRFSLIGSLKLAGLSVSAKSRRRNYSLLSISTALISWANKRLRSLTTVFPDLSKKSSMTKPNSQWPLTLSTERLPAPPMHIAPTSRRLVLVFAKFITMGL
jgi:hypothetical protein